MLYLCEIVLKKETNNNNERKGYHFNGFRIIGMRFL